MADTGDFNHALRQEKRGLADSDSDSSEFGVGLVPRVLEVTYRMRSEKTRFPGVS